MKTTLKALAVILGMAALLFNCDSTPDPVVPDRTVRFNSQLEFQTTVYFFKQPNVVNHEQSDDMTRTDLISTGVSNLDNFRKFEITMSHDAYKLELNNMVRIEGGEVTIVGELGNQLFGQYDGYSKPTSDLGDLEFVIRITGGEGSYADATGYLRANFVMENGYPDAGKMEIKGVIFNETKTYS